MHFHHRSFIGLLCIVLYTSVAQAADKAPPGYTDAIGQALTELEASNYPEAREEFRRAHAIYPNARTLRGLGMVEFELRNYSESAQLLEQALASSEKALEGKLREETESLLKRAQRYLGEIELIVEPRDAELQVDGNGMKLRPDGILRLDVGSHALKLSANGLSEERKVEVSGGRRKQVRISLIPKIASATPSAEAGSRDVAPTKPTPTYKKWWVWTTVVLVAAAGGTAAALLLMRKKEPADAQTGTNTVDGVRLHTLERF